LIWLILNQPLQVKPDRNFKIQIKDSLCDIGKQF
jgi:hypothetical protein